MPSLRKPASLLSFGTGLLLTLPDPALAAAPDPGIDWQAEVAGARAKPGPGARPARRTRKPRPTPAVASPDASSDPRSDVPVPDATTATTTPHDPPTDQAAVDAPPAPTHTPPDPITATPPPTPAPAPPRHSSTAAPTFRARAELVTGSLLAAGGLAALGVLANGLHVHRISERELARDGAYPPELLAPIERQHDRSETRIAAGAVAGVVGLGLGAALIAAGVRELRPSRRSHARVRVAPTLAGLQVNVRF